MRRSKKAATVSTDTGDRSPRAAEVALAALTRALRERPLPPDQIHHSDRGVQYSCGAYVDLLTRHRVRLSISCRGNPYDNAKAESFMKTLKTEQVDGRLYATLEEARQHIVLFLNCYNRQRLHSALNYRSPEEFETDRLAVAQHFAEGQGI